MAPAALTSGLAVPPVAGEECVYDDDGGGAGLVRLDGLTAVEVPADGSAGLAAAAGFGAWTGFFATKPEDEGWVRDGDVFLPPVANFFPAEKLGLGLAEEERAGKLSSVFS